MQKISPDEQKIHEEFTFYGQNAREWTRKCALLLPEIERKFIWRKKSFGSLFEYAAKIAGMSRDSVVDALRIGRSLEAFPALKKVAEEKGLQRVRPILATVTSETELFWAEKARTMSKMTLQTYVKDLRLERRSKAATESENVTVQWKVSPALAKKLEMIAKRVDFEELLQEFVDGVEAREGTAAVANGSRYIPVAVKHEVLERTSGECAFPSCHRLATSLHHTQRFALEKVHDPDRLHPVCTAHERIAHLGLIENEEKCPDRWVVLEQQDKNLPKYYIDQFVQMFRHNAVSSSP